MQIPFRFRTGTIFLEFNFYRALAAQRLMYTAELLCGVYHTAAVLFPHDSSAATVIRVLQRPDAYLANMPSRSFVAHLSRCSVFLPCAC